MAFDDWPHTGDKLRGECAGEPFCGEKDAGEPMHGERVAGELPQGDRMRGELDVVDSSPGDAIGTGDALREVTTGDALHGEREVLRGEPPRRYLKESGGLGCGGAGGGDEMAC